MYLGIQKNDTLRDVSPTKTKTALFLNPQQVRQLKKLAKRLDVSMSHLVREGIKLVIAKYSKI